MKKAVIYFIVLLCAVVGYSNYFYGGIHAASVNLGHTWDSTNSLNYADFAVTGFGYTTGYEIPVFLGIKGEYGIGTTIFEGSNFYLKPKIGLTSSCTLRLGIQSFSINGITILTGINTKIPLFLKINDNFDIGVNLGIVHYFYQIDYNTQKGTITNSYVGLWDLGFGKYFPAIYPDISICFNF